MCIIYVSEKLLQDRETGRHHSTPSPPPTPLYPSLLPPKPLRHLQPPPTSTSTTSVATIVTSIIVASVYVAVAIYHCYAKTPIGSAVAFTAVVVHCRVDESEIEIGNGSGRTGRNDRRGCRGWMGRWLVWRCVCVCVWRGGESI